MVEGKARLYSCGVPLHEWFDWDLLPMFQVLVSTEWWFNPVCLMSTRLSHKGSIIISVARGGMKANASFWQVLWASCLFSYLHQLTLLVCWLLSCRRKICSVRKCIGLISTPTWFVVFGSLYPSPAFTSFGVKIPCSQNGKFLTPGSVILPVWAEIANFLVIPLASHHLPQLHILWRAPGESS